MNSGRKFLGNITLAAALMAAPVIVTSCGSFVKPPVPTIVIDDIPSWDGDTQNSGLIDYIEGKGYLITANAAERYVWLTKTYSSDYSPPMKEGAGLTIDTETKQVFLDSEHMVEFMVMSQKYKSGIAPKNSQLPNITK
jgi:hypothetical protein